MPYGLYMSAEGAQAQARRMEVLANNLANVETPGFKRDELAFRERLAEAMVQNSPHASQLDEVAVAVDIEGTITDFSAGKLRRTGLPTDVAILGNAFFGMQNEAGDTLLTRAGNFAINSLGEFTSQNGEFRLLDAEGTPVVIDNTLPFSISSDGYLQQGRYAASARLVSAQLAERHDQSRAEHVPFARWVLAC